MQRYSLHISLTYLGVPVFVKVIYARDTPSVAIRVVHMAHVPCPVSRVTRHHCLKPDRMKSVTESRTCGTRAHERPKKKKKKSYKPGEMQKVHSSAKMLNVEGRRAEL